MLPNGRLEGLSTAHLCAVAAGGEGCAGWRSCAGGGVCATPLCVGEKKSVWLMMRLIAFNTCVWKQATGPAQQMAHAL